MFLNKNLIINYNVRNFLIFYNVIFLFLGNLTVTYHYLHEHSDSINESHYHENKCDICISYENIKNFDTDSKKELFLNTYDYFFLSYIDKNISFGLKIQLSSRAPPIS